MPPASSPSAKIRPTRAKWVSRKERSLWCCDFSDFEGDAQALAREIEVSDATICQQPAGSLLLAVDLCRTHLNPQIIAFFEANARRNPNPIRKLAVVNLSRFQQFWRRRIRPMVWPSHTRFFDDWEQAKDWLVSDRF